MTSGIYKIVNLVDGKIYVGSSKNIEWRILCHFSDLIHKKHHSIKLQRAYDKHGEQNFKFEIIETCEPKKEILLAREQHYLDTLKAVEYGYNINPTASSRLGAKCTQETKDKLSEISKRQKHLPCSKETRDKISAAQRGKIISDETKKKISESKTGSHHAPHSEETRKKISLAQIGKIISEETRIKISNTLKGNIPWNVGVSMKEETKLKIIASLTGRPSLCKGVKRGPMTEEQKMKISNTLKGKKKPQRTPEHSKKISENWKRKRLMKLQFEVRK